MSSLSVENLFKDKVLGHPAGLFVLFFTEMWERFSFYGMRVLLINFLTMAAIGYNPGWEWSAENAGALFGTYAGLLYLTPIVGGMIADKFTGYRNAVVIGALIMTLGHASMAFETEASLYIGLALLVIGTGFFKPNITSIISEMYKEKPEKKDGAYTIFYMGVNAGAFFGMMLCGYIAERIGWSWGFGLAGIFMLLGTLQFWLARNIFGTIGEKPSKVYEVELPQNINEKHSEVESKQSEPLKEGEKLNPFTLTDKILVFITSVIGLGYLLNDPISKVSDFNLFPFEINGIQGQNIIILVGLSLFIFLAVSRISRYTKIVRDRMIAFIIFALFTVFFWMSFEQGASSLIIFARDSVDRILSGNAAIIYNIVNALLTLVPLAIISWVLYLLWKKTYAKIPNSNIILVVCFLLMWGLVGWMLNRDFNTKAYLVSYEATKTISLDETGKETVTYKAISNQSSINEGDITETVNTTITELLEFNIGEKIHIIAKTNDESIFGYLNDTRLSKAIENGNQLNRDNRIIEATVLEVKSNEVEIPVSWFSILNSFFIIAFASLFSKWFDSKYNPSAAAKYALGLIIMALGFGLLALGSFGIEEGVKVSMMWLVFAYLFHTLGELSMSPVGLSYVSKLVPPRMIAFMFGMWYLAIAIGNKLAAMLGGEIENITEEYSLAGFFLIFTIIPAVAGVLIFLMNPMLKKLMHGVR
jgi:proton-dependent oligopeptide transporter, POT family